MFEYMKKIIYLCCLLIFCTSCKRTSVYEEAIEKLQLSENGFCNISLGEDVYSIVEKLGDVNPADYSQMFCYRLEEVRNFNGINALVIASFPCVRLASDLSGNGLYSFFPVNASELILAIPCYEDYNENLAGKRLELYDAVCNYYRQEFSPILEDVAEISTFFHIRVPSKANSIIEPNAVIVQQDEENDCVIVLINDSKDFYERWRNGEL